MNQVAFVFPGQGSQSVGMLAELSLQSPLVRTTFEEASESLDADLWKLAQEGPEERLNATEITQPVMLAAGVACWRVWRSLGGFVPGWMAGHSLGEYTALVAAGTLDFGTAAALVAERARRMQSATPAGTGAMAAILGLDDAALAAVCATAAQGQVVSCANFNAPGQVVIAGHAAAVQRAGAAALEAGARRVIPLAVSVPSHCALMQHAADDFGVTLANTSFAGGGTPVLHNADVQAHTTADEIRLALVRQLSLPVRWTDTIRELESRGATRFAECGPGKVLAGLNRRIVRAADTVALTDLATMQQTIDNWSQS